MIYPSIDISGGKAVQLQQGKKKILEREDPLSLAREFGKFGQVAVIDLDAARERGRNDEILKSLCRTCECRVGGGIRSLERAQEILDWGAEKIIIGTRAVKTGGLDQRFLGTLADNLGRDRIILALDAWEHKIVTRGWREHTGIRLEEVVPEAEPYASELLLTCVDKEGLMKGGDLTGWRNIRKMTDMPVTAAGGIASLGEIEVLARLNMDIQLGMALYTGRFTLSEAFSAACDWSAGLLPTITIDPAGQVLMLAYSSLESLKNTFDTGQVWYFSRSRDRLWKKGETSGHIQEFKAIRMDCDGDALLITAEQKGLACHTDRYSCFGGRRFSLSELYAVLRQRLKSSPSNSYSASLSEADIKDKIAEEAAELIQAESRAEIVWEAADLLYFILLRLARSQIDLDEVLGELKRRRRSTRSSERRS
jgi:phosphoribosyl-ATP pyrophosphohydrolase/phosphoribosyl-AMP cyclohydrolase